MDRLAACHVMHGFLNIHKEAKKRNNSSLNNHAKKSSHRSHSLSERKGVISTLKDENKKYSQSHHRESDSHKDDEDDTFNSLFHRVLDYGTSNNNFYHYQIETLLDPVQKITLTNSSKYKLPNHHSDIFSSPRYYSKNFHSSQNNLKCGYLLLSINFSQPKNELSIYIEKGANLPISQPHKKSVSYIKVVLIQDHQFVNCAKSGTYISKPFIDFDKTFTFKLTKNQPTLSLLILVIQKSNNSEERELGHLTFGDEDQSNNQFKDIKNENEKKRYLMGNTINKYDINWVSKQNEIKPPINFISGQKLFNQNDCLLNEYHSRLDNNICNWFKLSNKW
ncbi:Hypothetical protein SRAE_X000118100 [Strongyloides ratti]|uniref:C2 domain-containing protein n=1 Tax=Strongyloides ratti TaxID=34506 RepID=A0A090KPA7_STRRB|nr:Hypothetical protein SRAE_X000118100 [Strongyloides ratti]CEF59433.1 Hypothetical protein SRAE_X000118100 [Strongyloides ratti]